MRRVRTLLAPLMWHLNRGTELDTLPVEGGVSVQPLLVTCLHPSGCWSYCTGGYRYCLCCMKVRVRC